jgi:hypothetical protein
MYLLESSDLFECAGEVDVRDIGGENNLDSTAPTMRGRKVLSQLKTVALCYISRIEHLYTSIVLRTGRDLL